MSLPASRPQLRLWLLCNVVALALSALAFLATRTAALEGVAGFFLAPGLFLSAFVGCGVYGECGAIPLLLASTLVWGGIITILANLVLDMKREWTRT
jgi:hypothetical protein